MTALNSILDYSYDNCYSWQDSRAHTIGRMNNPQTVRLPPSGDIERSQVAWILRSQPLNLSIDIDLMGLLTETSLPALFIWSVA